MCAARDFPALPALYCPPDTAGHLGRADGRRAGEHCRAAGHQRQHRRRYRPAARRVAGPGRACPADPGPRRPPSSLYLAGHSAPGRWVARARARPAWRPLGGLPSTLWRGPLRQRAPALLGAAACVSHCLVTRGGKSLARRAARRHMRCCCRLPPSPAHGITGWIHRELKVRVAATASLGI